MATGESHLEVNGITKRFGGFTALEDIAFQAAQGEFLSILGPSGCGKTTLLRIVAGIEKQDGGSVKVAGKEVSHLSVSKRQVGIVFQSYALFPNLTAEQNIAYGLRDSRRGKAGIRKRIGELLELVGLEDVGRQYPAQLSGGQQQRVALARAIATEPSLLLLDEPLSALDAKVRARLRNEVRRLQQRLSVTTLMVTHDQEEALSMADRILVMNDGRLLQAGTPSEIYDHPANTFVASFIGSMNFIHNTVKDSNGIYKRGRLRLAVSEPGHVSHGTSAILGIRPEDVLVLNGETREAHPNALPAVVKRLEYRGANYRLTLRLAVDDEALPPIEAEIPTERIRRLEIREDMNVEVDLPVNRLRVYAA